MTKADPFDTLWVINQAHENWIASRTVSEKRAPSWSGIVFSSGLCDWAVSLTDINEIVPSQYLTPVPNVKKWMKGIFNLRGNLLGVTDLAAFMGVAPTKITHNARILACCNNAEWVGVLVEQVITLIRVEESDFRIMSEDDIPVGAKFFVEKGLVFRGKLIPILNLKTLLVHPLFTQVSSAEIGKIG